MSKKPVPFNRIIQLFQQLHKDYPSQNLGRHLSMALSDYGDLWGVSDKEIVHALEKYIIQLDTQITSEQDIERIIADTDRIFMDYDPLEDDEEDF